MCNSNIRLWRVSSGIFKPIITTKVSDYEQVEGKYGYVTDKSIDDIYEKMKLFIEKGFDIKQEFDANQYNSEIIKKLERIFWKAKKWQE